MANDISSPGPLDYSRVPVPILREVLKDENEGVDLFEGSMFYEIFGWKYESFRKETNDE